MNSGACGISLIYRVPNQLFQSLIRIFYNDTALGKSVSDHYTVPLSQKNSLKFQYEGPSFASINCHKAGGRPGVQGYSACCTVWVRPGGQIRVEGAWDGPTTTWITSGFGIYWIACGMRHLEMTKHVEPRSRPSKRGVWSWLSLRGRRPAVWARVGVALLTTVPDLVHS